VGAAFSELLTISMIRAAACRVFPEIGLIGRFRAEQGPTTSIE
jgi:hypothetical protein